MSIGVKAPATLIIDLRQPVTCHHEDVYSTKRLRFLSRAIHKLAFESIALGLYVLGNQGSVDLFSSEFDQVRRWVRYGEPQAAARPWLWWFPTQEQLVQGWRVEPLQRWQGSGYAQLRVFGHWFVADLSSAPADVIGVLVGMDRVPGVVCLSDEISLMIATSAIGSAP